MVNIINRKNFYQIEGGGLPLDAPTYVHREADDQLYQFAISSESNSRVCSILAPRQTGKTSLRIRTAKRLVDAGAVCIQIDLQRLGTIESNQTQIFWFTLLHLICEQITVIEPNLLKCLDDVWKEKPKLLPTVKFENFLIEEILNKIVYQKLIIFIDEIQTLITWEIQNKFFGFIRALSQSQEESLQRLNFVFLGVANPSDLITNAHYTFNIGKSLQLGNFTGDCEPLQEGLKRISSDPIKILDIIIEWTGGQPFLTQILCDLVASHHINEENIDWQDYIERIVFSDIIEDWRNRDRQNHFHEVENWFIRVNSSKKADKISALKLYRKILSGENYRFREGDKKHWELLMSGLIFVKSDRLEISNRIYRKVFDLAWIEEQEQYLLEDIMPEPFSTIYNRDVFMLIDQSGSMVRKDADTADQSRYEYLEEVVEGHVNAILEHKEAGKKTEQKICNEVSIHFFSLNRVAPSSPPIKDSSQVQSLFLENKPKTKTFVASTLNHCIDTWLETGKPQGRGAFYIIYTDGLFDDVQKFIECIVQACKNIDNHKAVKFIILGIGQDVDVERFLELDYNTNNQLPDNVIVFDLVNEIEDIIELLERQLIDNPDNVKATIPEWVQPRYPDLYQKLLEARQDNV